MRFRGAPYPIVKTPRGLLPTNNGTAQIKADLLQLLQTNPRERVMLPDFGVPFRELAFEPNDETVAITARQMIINAINLWEPRITVEELEVRVASADDLGESLNPLDDLSNRENILLIRIKFFDPEQISEVQELRLELPLAGEGVGGVIQSTGGVLDSEIRNAQ